MNVKQFVSAFVDSNTLIRLHYKTVSGHQEVISGDKPMMEHELVKSKYADMTVVGVTDILYLKSHYPEALNLIIETPPNATITKPKPMKVPVILGSTITPEGFLKARFGESVWSYHISKKATDSHQPVQTGLLAELLTEFKQIILSDKLIQCHNPVTREYVVISPTEAKIVGTYQQPLECQP